MNRAHCKALTVLLCLFSSAFLHASSSNSYSSDTRLFSTLKLHAPGLNSRALESALKATDCAVRHGLDQPQRLAVIDYSMPSSEKRMWIFDLGTGKLLLRDLVAHGRNSGNILAKSFSNDNGSHRSSLGLFRAAESYHGKHGYSLRLDGLEPGFNDRARERAIVIHGADYVAPQWISQHGRIGRSLGCPAVRKQIARQVVDNLKEGQFVFSYYPDEDWLASSSFLNCDSDRVADISTIDADKI